CRIDGLEHHASSTNLGVHVYKPTMYGWINKSESDLWKLKYFVKDVLQAMTMEIRTVNNGIVCDVGNITDINLDSCVRQAGKKPNYQRVKDARLMILTANNLPELLALNDQKLEKQLVELGELCLVASLG
ncbi:hypothetical protein Tco_0887838, partial [Tanacetum coccineum]